MRGTELGVGHETSLGAGEGVGVRVNAHTSRRWRNRKPWSQVRRFPGISRFHGLAHRNSINIGLAILECDEAAKDIKDGDEVKVDFDTGVIENVTTGKTYQAEPFPPFIQNIISKGGLLKSIGK